MASSVKDGCEREEDLLDDLLHKVKITVIVGLRLVLLHAVLK